MTYLDDILQKYQARNVAQYSNAILQLKNFLINWADEEEEGRVGNMARSVGHVFDIASANIVIIEVQCTASSEDLIGKVVPLIAEKVTFCGGNPGVRLLEYVKLEKENIPGYWFSKDTHVFNHPYLNPRP